MTSMNDGDDEGVVSSTVVPSPLLLSLFSLFKLGSVQSASAASSAVVVVSTSDEPCSASRPVAAADVASRSDRRVTVTNRKWKTTYE